MSFRRTLSRALLWSVPLLLLVIQLIPYGRSHENPPVVADAPWDTPRTKELFLHTCGDCHSNRTAWPWYSSVAPLSWILQRDVEEGRRRLNVSEPGIRKGEKAAQEFEEGEMPPAIYSWIHPSARLRADERAELIRGLEATFGRAHDDSPEPR